MQVVNSLATSNFKLIESAEKAILRTILYFDVFKYPLLKTEVVDLFSSIDLPPFDIISICDGLVSRGLIFEERGFLLATQDYSLIDRRLKGNIEAERYFGIAKRVAGVIASFPFVRGIMLSGSLSKNYMDAGSDLDLFIVTEKNRLWLTRSFLAVVKKILPRRVKQYCCMNYFIDLTSLNIPDRNVFTATELAFLYPVFGPNVLDGIIGQNEWFRQFYPNTLPRVAKIQPKPYFPRLKWALEKIFSGKLGDSMERFLFNFMCKRWKRRYNTEVDSPSAVNIRTRKNVSKHHEKGHQQIVLGRLAESVLRFNQKHSTNISL